MPARGDLCRVIVLGSTGSIGTQTLEVIEHLNVLHRRGAWPTRYEIIGLAARANDTGITHQAAKFMVREMALSTASGVKLTSLSDAECSDYTTTGELSARTRFGDDAAERLVRDLDCDVVVAAMSGAAGLPATLAAVELGRDIALANKETLVAAGALIVPAARRSGSRLLPVDSEHSAVWQCLAGLGAAASAPAAPPMELTAEVARLILTASGGPFRTWTRDQTYQATPEQALKHPTWSMGPKVTIDSASLTNKALEIIEAHWLFGLPADRIDVLIHPQSIIHAIVELADGSALAQLGAPDMRGPIQYALSFPRRPPGTHRSIPWPELRTLELELPDEDRFPALGLARRAITEGGASGAILNAANEAAVEAFLAYRIPFGRIPELTAAAMTALGAPAIDTLESVLCADAAARSFVREHL